MKNKKTPLKSLHYTLPSSILDSNFSESTIHSSKLSQQLLSYYKDKSQKLEKEFDDLLQLFNKIESVCDSSNELRMELGVRNEEVSKLQKFIADLQVHLFREKEKNLKLTAENDKLRIEDYKNKKKINLLLMANGTCDKKFLHFVTNSAQDNFVQTNLPPKLQKLKEAKQRQLTGQKESTRKETSESSDVDPQILLLDNQLLACQLEQHIKISREEIEILLKEKEISDEERKIERQRLQNEIDLIALKLKESQELLCEMTKKAVKFQQIFEKEKSEWMEERDQHLKTINQLKKKYGDDIPELIGYSLGGVDGPMTRLWGVSDTARDKAIEKEKATGLYQARVLGLEAEVHRLRERAQQCQNTFKDKTEKMRAHVVYLKSKYEDLDRRRHLEAEGFRTDIRMLKERVKELEKKLTKVSGLQSSEQYQLLASAKNTLNRAKLLEKELEFMKTKILTLESKAESWS